MLDLTFGEQVKIILSRKGMTIKELAEMIEERTGKKMSRQNLTQRLGRDNFQEQDMRMIAEILDCPFQLNILGDAKQPESADEENVRVTEAELLRLEKKKGKKRQHSTEREMTIGELVDLNRGLDELLEEKNRKAVTLPEEAAEPAVQEEELQPADAESYEAQEEEVQPDVAENVFYQKGGESDPEAGWTEETVQEESAQDTAQAYAAESDIEQADAAEEENMQEQTDAVQPDDLPDAEKAQPVSAAKEEPQERPARKTRGSWRDFFQRRTKKDAKEMETEDAAPVSDHQDEVEPQEAPSEKVEETAAKEAVHSQETAEDILMRAEAADEEEDLEKGEVNPYTGHEYESNTVRMHPKRIGYVQVYDRSSHQWTDMTEWAFLGYQERKKALLGNDYEPPIYLD